MGFSLTIPLVNFRLLLFSLDGEGIATLLRGSEDGAQIGPIEIARGPALDYRPRILVAIQVFFFLLVVRLERSWVTIEIFLAFKRRTGIVHWSERSAID